MDMGSHCIDLSEKFFGNVKSVTWSVNMNIHDYKSEDSALFSLMFENVAMIGLCSQKILAACYESDWTGKQIEV